MKYYFGVFIATIFSATNVFAYEPSRWDQAFLNIIQSATIDANWSDRDKEQKGGYDKALVDTIDRLDGERYIRFFSQLLEHLRNKSKPTDPILKTVEVSPNDVGSLRVRSGSSYDASILGVLPTGDQKDIYEERNGFFRIRYDEQYAWIAVEYTHLAGTETPTHHLTISQTPIPATTVAGSPYQGTTSGTGFKREFLERHWSLVDTKDKEILGLCTKYFDQVDEIAREYDFPVELIIATWYREHTCKFFNPGNGRGNFQITSNYYTPGDITRAEFESQVVDFIKFSRGKREYYDAVQTYGPDPIELSYDSFDLSSIRKQAIFYNGIVGELDTNRYANTNFNGVNSGGVDGIVAYFLKVLDWELN